MAKRLRLAFWLLVMDALALRWFGSPAYLWAVGKASGATDWGEPLEPYEPSPEDPF